VGQNFPSLTSAEPIINIDQWSQSGCKRTHSCGHTARRAYALLENAWTVTTIAKPHTVMGRKNDAHTACHRTVA